MAASPFLNRIRNELRLRGYSLKTEKSYIHWIKRFIHFHKLRHPETMGAGNPDHIGPNERQRPAYLFSPVRQRSTHQRMPANSHSGH